MKKYAAFLNKMHTMLLMDKKTTSVEKLLSKELTLCISLLCTYMN